MSFFPCMIYLNLNKLLFNIYVKILSQWVKCKWLSYHSTIIIHTKYPPFKTGKFVEKMVTNSFWNKSFTQPMKQFNMHLQKPNYFAFGGILFKIFWECGVFTMFEECSHHVFTCSQWCFPCIPHVANKIYPRFYHCNLYN